MKSLWLKFAPLFVVLMLATSGCSSLKIGAVSVNVVDLKPVSASPLETQTQLTVRYINENIFGLGISGTTHKLYLNGRYIGRAVNNDPIGLPPLGTATQNVTLFVENLSLLPQLTDAAASKKISYRIDSVLYLLVSEEKHSIRTSSSGELDLSNLAGKQ